MSGTITRACLACLVPVLAATPAGAAAEDLAARLRGLDEKELAAQGSEAKLFPQMLAKDARPRRDAANRRETAAWQAVRGRADWERFVAPRLEALRRSLGDFPPPPKELAVRVA